MTYACDSNCLTQLLLSNKPFHPVLPAHSSIRRIFDNFASASTISSSSVYRAFRFGRLATFRPMEEGGPLTREIVA